MEQPPTEEELDKVQSVLFKLISAGIVLLGIATWAFTAISASQMDSRIAPIREQLNVMSATAKSQAEADNARTTRLEVQAEMNRQQIEHYAQQVMINTKRLDALEDQHRTRR